MSGGSWDYLCYKMMDAAGRLQGETCEYRKAFGKKLAVYAEAMKVIEWVDSDDMGYPNDVKAIKKALGDDCKALVLDEVKMSLNVWQQAIDEELVKYEIGVAKDDATFDQAKKAIHDLIMLNIEIATDPRVGGDRVIKNEQS